MFVLIFKVKLTWAQVNLTDFTMGAGESPLELFLCLKSLLHCLDELPLFWTICGGILCYRTFWDTFLEILFQYILNFEIEISKRSHTLTIGKLPETTIYPIYLSSKQKIIRWLYSNILRVQIDTIRSLCIVRLFSFAKQKNIDVDSFGLDFDLQIISLWINCAS